MSFKLTLPPPPKVYDQRYEVIRNREIERVVNTKIGANDLSVYSGTPFTSVKGTNTNFVIPQGTTLVKLPFDTLVKDTDSDIVFDPLTNSITNPFTMDCVFFLNLRHAAAPGSTYDFTIQAFINNVAVIPPYTQTINNSETQDIRLARFIVNFPAASTIDLRVVHNRNGSVALNMALSQWDILRISPLPSLVQQ